MLPHASGKLASLSGEGRRAGCFHEVAGLFIVAAGCLFSARVFFKFVGVTRSYTSQSFLCALVIRDQNIKGDATAPVVPTPLQ